MSVLFKQEGHIYESVNPVERIDWLGVTTFVAHFKEPFDPIGQSIKSSRNKRSKWYNIPPEKIREIWNSEGDRASGMGTWYHDQRETDIIEFDTIERDGITVPIFKPVFVDGIKHAPEQKLVDGVYPEHFVYLKSAGLCGQSDRVEVVNSVVSISDYKTNKELKVNSYKGWDGVPKMMSAPLSHLEDCHLMHYALQLSLYLYVIIKHNPKLKPGKLTIDHVIFEIDHKDEYDNPVYKQDEFGNFIVKEVVPYEVPYLKNEVIAMINYLHENRSLIKKKS
jgi:hypothetical protein